MHKNFLFLILFFLIFKTQGQKLAENQLGTWYMYNGSHKLTDKFALKTMAHFRYYELASDFQQEIYRLGLNYSLNTNTNFTLGLSYATADLVYNVSSNDLYEYRLYEDLNIKGKWQKIALKHRFRFEQRFIHKNTTQNQFQNWIRYDLNIGYPISKSWGIYVFNELFLNLDRNKRFEQNWTGAGFLHQLNSNLKLKLGYFQIKSSANILKRLQVGVILNTNFFNK